MVRRTTLPGNARPRQGRRVVHRRSGAGGNIVHKLGFREIGGIRGRTPPSPNAAFCAEKFRRFKLQEEFDICVDMELPRMNSIMSITVANDIIFVIEWQGLCYAFRHNANGSILPYERYGRLQCFNRPYENIESVFYNKINDSIIIVSSFSTYAGYYLRVLSLEIIRNDNWEVGAGAEVFGPHAKVLPFFDDCNQIAVVSATITGSVNNVYEMNNYNIVHTIHGKIHSIAKRPGVLIVRFRRQTLQTYLPIVVYSTENWSILKRMDYYNATPSRRIHFNETHNEIILLKETCKNMQIIDIWNHNSLTVIKRTKDVRQFLCFDLTANNLLLKLDNDKAVICNSCGLQVSLLEDNEVTGYKSNITCLSNMVVTMDKNYAIFYSMRESEEKPRDGATHGIQGSINISSTFNGKSIMKINPCNDDLDLMVDTQKRGENYTANVRSSIHEALKDVTVLCYDEKHHKIYTGNSSGFLHVWSN